MTGTAANAETSIDADIATLERLNKLDAKLCEDLRHSCRLNTSGVVSSKSRGQNHQEKPSCWALVTGAGVSKKAFSSSASISLGGDGNDTEGGRDGSRRDGSGGEDDDGTGNTSNSRKRVFSK